VPSISTGTIKSALWTGWIIRKKQNNMKKSLLHMYIIKKRYPSFLIITCDTMPQHCKKQNVFETESKWFAENNS